jgi:CNT family concentrative nucleoside transporter
MALALQSLIGIILIPIIAWTMSEDRARPGGEILGVVLAGLALQALIAALLLYMPGSRVVFEAANAAVVALQTATGAGMQLLFGYLAGGPAPFEVRSPANAFLLAFGALPMILVLSALARLLYHWGVLQMVVRGFAAILQRTFGIGGPLGTAAAANVFLGMVEAPLLVRPYLAAMGRGALFATMVVGMATVAGTVMAIYAAVLQPVLPGAAGHVLAASLMNVPAALMLARLMVPAGFAGGPHAIDTRAAGSPRSAIDAIVEGTIDGLRLLASVIALLVVMTALVALANIVLSALGPVAGAPVTLQRALGLLCAPLAFAIGIPWGEALAAGSLLGQKIVLNEFVAYFELARIAPAELTPRSRLVMTYALCGFANLGALGIMLGGLTAMVPERRSEIVALGWRSMIAGALATMLSGAVVGLLVWG